MSHTVEIIGVGSELLLGNVANTDARDISEGLSALGLNVYYHTVVGDNPERLTAAVEIAKSRASIIITTGGLGPTCDDLTKQVLAAAFGKRLVFSEPDAEEIRSFFERGLHGTHMTENNLQQAMLPEGCEIFHNEWGTAPGCAFEVGGVHVLMLPGPPRECRAMFNSCAVPYLRKLSEEQILSRSIRVFGPGESGVEDKLRDLMNELQNPTLAPYAKEGEVMLRVTAKAASRSEAEALMAPVLARVREVLGDVIYGEDVDSLEVLDVALLRDRGLTLAVAESCTGGLLSKRVTDVPGASAVFLGGVTGYSNGVKERLLGVSKELLEREGAVSRDVAAAMAAGVRASTGADVGVGITGLAGPDGDGKNDVGTVFVALEDKNGAVVRETHLGRGRERVRVMAANHALDMLRRRLLGLDMEIKYF